jgi:predicted dehydrogenase
MGERVRIGVIGLGMGRNHAVQYRQCPEAELVALCDINAARREQVNSEVGPCRLYEHPEELLADEQVDAVSVALPNVLHHPVTMAALRAGKHVLCEKPLAMNACEAEEMVVTARAGGRTLMVHFNVRFHATSMAVRRAVEEGRLGHIYYARTVWHRQRGIPGMGGWFTRKELSGGGALIDIGVHRLDLALWLMGYPRAVSVTGVAYNYLGTRMAEQSGQRFDVDDLAAAFIRFENGAALTLETSWASNSEKREDQWTQLFGTDGGATVRNWDEGYQFEARLFLAHGAAGEGVRVEHPVLPEHPESAQAHFCRCLLRGEEPLATGEQGLEVMRILDAIYASAASGKEVTL